MQLSNVVMFLTDDTLEAPIQALKTLTTMGIRACSQ